ncbi:hypothetical protein OHC33_008697 [Knufia fluminis]|uniref:Adenylate cyclase n=1 Tax=Knufia fluminis TaxID=191047 RepID=A0AAN8EA20_9EURO|nr:hypothetical protein OHC33_008697 [Knufia fluminis]
MASRKGAAMVGQTHPAPSSKIPPSGLRARSTTIAPWDEPASDLARDPTDIAPWEQDPQAMIGGTRPFNQSYFNDAPRDYTPPPRPYVNSRHNSEVDPWDAEIGARRPSVASNDTISSIGSRNSAANGKVFKRKRLDAYLGDDAVNDNSRKGSQTVLAQNDTSSSNDDKNTLRNNSIQTAKSVEERPKTPLPSSNVTPWDYQNFEDVSKFGSAPIRQELGPETNGEPKQQSTASAIKGRLLPHRHTKSKDDPPKTSNLAPPAIPQRPATSREVSSNNIPISRNSPYTSTPMSSTSNLPRTQQVPSNQEKNGGTIKRKFPFKLGLHRHRDKQPPTEDTQPLPRESVAPVPGDVQGRARGLSGSSKKTSVIPTTASEKKDRESSVASVDTIKGPEMPKIDRTFTASSEASKRSRLRGLGHGRVRDRTMSSAQSQTNQGSMKNDPLQTPGIWTIDTNFEDLSDILHQPPGQDQLQAVDPEGKPLPQTPATEPAAPAWDAPDSWAVKGQDAGIGTQPHDVAEYGLPAIEEEDGVHYFMRVFRSDGTFATLSMLINATVGEVLQSLAKKSVLHDQIENYHLILRKNQLSRQLGQGERPIAMQKKLLLQAGYQEEDHIEEVGREDNSYLCRFTFSHEKQTGFGSGLDNDPSFNKMQKFSHVDLSGRSMITIPIILYTKAPEIISLNLSRNLALAVPKDFITACINLREIKFTGNEAWQIPASLAWASRLNVLDLSNNRLEELDHAELHRLTGLVSLKLSNNNLAKLPNNFSHFRQLRSLNISSNNFKELPEQVYHLKSLAELDVSFNKIGHLAKISALTALERLWMTNNDLKGPFNEGFRQLTNLKEVDVRFNNVTNIDNVAGCPNLETLLVGHNAISAFKGSFKRLRTLQLDHNPMTEFDLVEPVPTLNSLNIGSAKLVDFKDTIFDYMSNLQKLILDKNHFSNMPSGFSKLTKLQHLSMAKNRLNAIPQSIGSLVELKHLNLRECNVRSVPGEIWYCRSLEMLNLSSNVLESFPRINAAPPPPEALTQMHKDSNATLTPGLSSSPSFEDLGKLEDFQNRRPSQVSTSMLSIGSSPGGAGRKNSMMSMSGTQGRKMSQISRTNTEYSMATATRKDSNLSQARLHNTFAGSLRYLYLADNRLEDEVFRELVWLQELRMLNLSYNEIDDFPGGVLKRWPQLTDLYLSGNSLTSLPSEDFEESSNLRNLYLNVNRFQVLPAELCNVHKLAVLDVGSNSLKYNVSNWPYDWNWNRNTNLKYLNFSANRRLEIKPAHQSSLNQFAAMNGGEHRDLTSFTTLNYLRVLGLMDVTLLTNTIPDDNEDRRVRTSTTSAGALMYGMADTLGKNDHLSTLDLLKENFRGHDAEIIVGMFDGQSLQSGGSKVAKYLHEHFASNFQTELNKADREEDSPENALRRSFLSLNKEMANYASSAIENREHRLQNGRHASSVANLLSADDLNAGCVAAVMYLNGLDLYVANVGDIEAICISTNGQSRPLTSKHQPAETAERDRIRAAGGYVSRQGKLNDTIEVSRAFGYFNAMPSIIAAPSTQHMAISETDELIVIATKEFWDFVTVDLAVDLARAEKADLMVAAQKLRDIAIAFGARDKIMVQVLGVTDLRKRNNHKFRAGSFSMARELSSDPDNQIFTSATRKRKGRDQVADSELARMEEPEAPTGEVAICFTDIKNSTALWEILPVPMRGAIQLHNQLMRRQLRIVGGYEVKTEGDAFMCSFPTVTSALLWTFIVQNSLLDLQWPTEIMDTVHCQEKYDADGNVIYRGLSVRMGIHWGRPVCEPDPITRRMDYFGPMVNKAARVSAVADGGQISVSTDFISEIRRTLEAFAEDDDRRDSVGSNDTMDDPVAVQIRKELRQLSSLGFEVKELGEKKLKGLENPEFIYLMYPHGLSGRLEIPPGAGDQPANMGPQDRSDPAALEEGSTLGKGFDLSEVWKLWDIALRLEMFCSSLEDPDRTQGLRKPEMSLLTNMKDRGGQVGDQFMINLLEHQVTRVENCVSALQVRHMMIPLKMGVSLAEQARPIQDILAQMATMLEKYKGVNPEQKGSMTRKVQELDESDDD